MMIKIKGCFEKTAFSSNTWGKGFTVRDGNSVRFAACNNAM